MWGLCRRVTLGHICFNASYVFDKVPLIRWKNTAERLIYEFYRQGETLALKYLLGGKSLVIAIPLHAFQILMSKQLQDVALGEIFL